MSCILLYCESCFVPVFYRLNINGYFLEGELIAVIGSTDNIDKC